MRIIYLYDTIALWGGIERVLVDKMNYLSTQYQYEIFLVTTNQGMHIMPYQLAPTITHIDLDINFHKIYRYKFFKRQILAISKRVEFRKKFRDITNQIKPNIIITTTESFVDIITDMHYKIPIIVESHSIKSHTRMIETKPLTILQKIARYKYLKTIKRATALITLTQGDADEWKNIKKATIIPNIITFNKEEYSTCKQKHVIFVGRLAFQKGVEYAIKAWEIVSKKHPEWVLDIYGEGEYEKEYRSLIKKLHIEKNVIIHAPTLDIFNKYKQSSIFILTSRYEPFGLVIAEAMSCGLPCISFDCPYGPRDIINDGINGFLVPNGNIQALANKICFLIENTSLRIKMGQNAKNSIQKYHPDIIMPIWKKLFHKLSQ